MSSRTRVLVLPGLAATDHSTQIIRASLAARGHGAHGWRLGRNEGPSERTAREVANRLADLFDRDQQPVALVGWSLGGSYAHWLAGSTPHLVHSVTTLGSPLRRNGSQPETLPVPTTSVYSRNDRVVPWQASMIDGGADRHENVEVRANHFTLGFDPAVLYLINDRVGQDPEAWKPFRRPRLLSAAFPTRP